MKLDVADMAAHALMRLHADSSGEWEGPVQSAGPAFCASQVSENHLQDKLLMMTPNIQCWSCVAFR